MSTPNSQIATTTGAGAGDSRPTAGPSDDPKKKRTKPKLKKQKPGNGNNNNNNNSTKFKGNVTSGALSGVVMDNPTTLVDDIKKLSDKLVLHVAVEEEQSEWSSSRRIIESEQFGDSEPREDESQRNDPFHFWILGQSFIPRPGF